jgi:carbonic anhydrase
MDGSPQSRREFLRHASLRSLALAGAVGGLSGFTGARRADPLTPDQSLARLQQGNRDFLAGKIRPASTDKDRRLQLARTQTPFAVLVGCSDSRVPPELLFGSGLGELFIVRNAGNTVDTVALGSIEYGALVLGAPLIVVLGHERCGAVDAAVHVVEENKTYPGSIGRMVEPIIPAVLRARTGGKLRGAALLDEAVRQNVLRVVDRLRESEPTLIEPMRAGKLKVVGARYDLDDGRVEFL